MFIDILRWIVAIPFALLFLMCSVGNWSLIIGAILGHVKSFSLVLPFLGPVFGILFCIAAPINGLAWFWWLAPLIEPSWILDVWILVSWQFVPKNSANDISTRMDSE